MSADLFHLPTDDPFGKDSTTARPIEQIIEESGKRGGMSVKKHLAAPGERSAARKAAKARERLWHAKTRDLYRSEGWFEFRCDETVTTQYGSFTRDLMGIGDREAWKPREGGGLRVALIQICSLEDVSKHLQKVANPKNTIDFDDRKDVPIRTLAEEILALGVEIHLISWEKVGAKWMHERKMVTASTLEAADTRRRK